MDGTKGSGVSCEADFYDPTFNLKNFEEADELLNCGYVAPQSIKDYAGAGEIKGLGSETDAPSTLSPKKTRVGQFLVGDFFTPGKGFFYDGRFKIYGIDPAKIDECMVNKTQTKDQKGKEGVRPKISFRKEFIEKGEFLFVQEYKVTPTAIWEIHYHNGEEYFVFVCGEEDKQLLLF